MPHPKSLNCFAGGRLMVLSALIWLCIETVYAHSCQPPFAVASRLLTINDPSRGRDIALRVDYPAAAAGSTVPLAGCGFPSLSMGHGFTISGEAYGWLRDGLVGTGVVLIRPLSESGLSPNHAQFGLDLRFADVGLRALPEFASALGPDRFVGGHSMGGGAAVLAASGQAISGLLLLAPAETNPSAIGAATSVLVPSLIFTGSRDCVTPSAQHAIPMLNAIPATDKQGIDLDGGSHCQFSDGSLTCSIGEASCSPATISAAAQHSAVLEFVRPWLKSRSVRIFQHGFE
jgi:hypothetical protein